MKKRKAILWGIAMMSVIFAMMALFDITVSRTASGKTYDNVYGMFSPHHYFTHQIS